jgi:hypothetical protein
MLSLPSRCESPLWLNPGLVPNSDRYRFIDTEKWRKDIKLDEILPTWDYPEKPEISKYYKQFYHKIDNVRFFTSFTYTRKLILAD